MSKRLGRSGLSFTKKVVGKRKIKSVKKPIRNDDPEVYLNKLDNLLQERKDGNSIKKSN